VIVWTVWCPVLLSAMLTTLSPNFHFVAPDYCYALDSLHTARWDVYSLEIRFEKSDNTRSLRRRCFLVFHKSPQALGDYQLGDLILSYLVSSVLFLFPLFDLAERRRSEAVIAMV
jgi:hypothetical protein